jgi:DNA-directed RNA polymerase subunit alpha
MISMEFILPKGLYVETLNDRYGRFVFVPLERGYGITIGNSLRRVLLSSIPGAAIVAVRIDGVLHEFSTIPGVLEDVPEIILNLKKIRLKFDETDEDRASLYLRAEGEREVKAGDLDVPASITVVNPETHIATLTKKNAKLYMELVVMRGRGYVPANEIPKAGFPEGTIFVDGLFSPIVKANYTVENVRVKARTDYEKLILDVWTDGTIKPDEAVRKASELLKEAIEKLFVTVTEPYGVKEVGFEEREKIRSLLTKSIEFLEPSKRTANCLRDAGIETIAQLVSKTEEEMLKIKNFGEKSLDEIKAKLEKFGLAFGMEVDEYLKEEAFLE